MEVVEIAFTIYPVTNLKRARQFYEATSGLPEYGASGTRIRDLLNMISTQAPSLSGMELGMETFQRGGCAAVEMDDSDGAMSRLRESQHAM